MDKIPDWMQDTDSYIPLEDRSLFAFQTIRSLGRAMAQISIQKGQERERHIPALAKFFLTIALILLTSLSQNSMILLLLSAMLLLYLATWPPRALWNIIKGSLMAAGIALLLFLPAMILKPEGFHNNMILVLKVFLCVAILSIFNHTTQWNHITKALRRIHIPGIFIFTLDITLKYIILLGNLINDLLTSLQLRSVGKNNRKYHSVGGVMGITFLRATEMNQQMYEAMLCRGFTDDYD